jgi:hypothetical protein
LKKKSTSIFSGYGSKRTFTGRYPYAKTEEKNQPIALGSASKNARPSWRKLESDIILMLLMEMMLLIKPDPEVSDCS